MGYKSFDKKLVVVLDGGTIPELNYICGPILNPCKLPIESIQKLVINKRTVFECNPNNPSERIQLTTRNVKKNNFKIDIINNIEPNNTLKPKMIYGGDVNITPISNNIIDDSETTHKKIESSTEKELDIIEDSKTQSISEDIVTEEDLQQPINDINTQQTVEDEVVEEESNNDEPTTNEDEDIVEETSNDGSQTKQDFNNKRKNRRNKK